MQATRVLVLDITRKPSKDQQIIIGRLSYSAAKLWNIANHAFKNQETDLYHLKHYLKDNLWYKNLHSQSAQAVLEKLQIAWKNYFKKHTKSPPGFQPKDGHFPVRWKKNGIKIIGNKLRLSISKQTRKYLKKEISDQQPGFRTMAIDLGFSNLATVVVEDETQAYIFDGRILFSRL